jgi:hypothetical protein
MVAPDSAGLRAAQAHVAFPPTATRKRHRTSHGGDQVDRSKMFRRSAPPATPPRSGVIQLFKCATRQNPTGPCSGAPIRTVYTARTPWGSGTPGRKTTTEPLGLWLSLRRFTRRADLGKMSVRSVLSAGLRWSRPSSSRSGRSAALKHAPASEGFAEDHRQGQDRKQPADQGCAAQRSCSQQRFA